MTAPALEIPNPGGPTPNVVPEAPTVPSDPTPDRETPDTPVGPGVPEPATPDEPNPVGPDVPVPDPKGPETPSEDRVGS